MILSSKAFLGAVFRITTNPPLSPVSPSRILHPTTAGRSPTIPWKRRRTSPRPSFGRWSERKMTLTISRVSTTVLWEPCPTTSTRPWTKSTQIFWTIWNLLQRQPERKKSAPKAQIRPVLSKGSRIHCSSIGRSLSPLVLVVSGFVLVHTLVHQFALDNDTKYLQ